jgi:hypothetical protein
MHKATFANCFGLVASFFLVSLFPTTSAWAQKTSGTATAQGPQQVIVANTTAQPVPMVGLVSVTEPSKVWTRLYLFVNILDGTPNGSNSVYTVPPGKRFMVEHLSADCTLDQSYSVIVQMNAGPNGVTAVYFPLTTLYFPADGPYRAEGSLPVQTFFDAGTPVQFTAFRGVTSGISACRVAVLGYLVPMPQ